MRKILFLWLLANLGFSQEVVVFPKIKWHFSSPYGIATDREGNLYIADSGNHRIQKLSPSGELIFQIGSFGEDPGQFNSPYDVAVDENGEIFVADTWNNRVQRFTKDGKFLLSWGSLGEKRKMFKFPHSLCVDKDSVYVADTGNARIQRFTKDGMFLFEFKDGLSWPTGIDIDEDGVVWVSDEDRKRVLRFTIEGDFLGQSEADFKSPHGIVARNGVLYVADTGSGRILKQEKGKVKAIVSGMKSPYDVAVDKDGNLYVAETGANRIQKLTRKGRMIQSYETKGEELGRFTYPYDIVVNKVGEIYVADTGNNRIYRFSPNFLPKDVWNVEKPTGLTTDAKDNLYVVSASLCKVLKFDRFGNLITEWSDGMVHPRQIAYDPCYDRIYVTDLKKDAVLRFTTSGILVGTITDGLKDPEGIACTESGNIYVADTGNNAIKRFSPWGVLTGEIEEGLSSPSDIVVSRDCLYILNTGKGEIQKRGFQGVLLERFGRIGTDECEFKHPYGLAIDGKGDLYVADTANHRVQKIVRRVYPEKRPSKVIVHKKAPAYKEKRETEEWEAIAQRELIKVEEMQIFKHPSMIGTPSVKPTEKVPVDIFPKLTAMPKKYPLLPDLVVENVSIEPAVCGRWTKVQTTIKNRGEVPASSVIIEFFADDERIGFDRMIPHLLKEAVGTKSTIWKPEREGTWTIKIFVDPSDTIEESDEENNVGKREIYVGKK